MSCVLPTCRTLLDVTSDFFSVKADLAMQLRRHRTCCTLPYPALKGAPMPPFVLFRSHVFRGAVPIALAFALMVPAVSAAATLGFDLTGGTTFVCPAGTAGCTAGFSFRVESPMNVTGLAFWDEGSDGIVSDHPVALWNIGGTLLATTTVTNGSAVVPSAGPGRWLVSSISPVNLSAGDYVLGALYAPESADLLRGRANVATSPPLVFLDARIAVGAGLTFPDAGFSAENAGFFGPSLVFEPVSIPEPAGMVTLGVGLAALLARRRRS